jgi:hypothetical protein
MLETQRQQGERSLLTKLRGHIQAQGDTETDRQEVHPISLALLFIRLKTPIYCHSFPIIFMTHILKPCNLSFQ